MGRLDSVGLKYVLDKIRAFLNGYAKSDEVVKSVNGNLPDETGDTHISEVDYANNLLSDNVQYSEGDFIMRTTGGHASISDGDAWLIRIHGRRIHTGVVEEYLVPSLELAPRPEPEEGEEVEEPIAISVFDKAVFRAYVPSSTTVNLYYTSAWSAEPSLYGITLSGTPLSGDHIQIVYVKEDLGTITQSTPSKFISTGWNLYNSAMGYARVIKYSDAYGFKIDGSYTGMEFSSTIMGDRTPIVPVDGAFTIPSDGYIWVAGASSDLAIWMVWTDWGEDYGGEYQDYSETDIDLTPVMTERFPNGLMQVGSVSDVIDLNIMSAIQNIERLENNAQNLALVQEQGREYEVDTQWIYAVLAEPVVHTIDVSGAYVASDHGYEIVDGTTVPVYVETMYGNNLKNKLERDVLTLSQQTIMVSQQNQVRANIKASKAVTVDMGTISSLPVTMTATGVTEKMICVASDLGTASAQTGDWTITTATDSVTISGTISGSTTVKLVLIEQDSVTATSA